MTLAEYRGRGGAEVPREDQHVAEAAHVEKHPGPLEYAQIGSVLALITGVEVAVSYRGLVHTLGGVGLMVLSETEFRMGALWGMHFQFATRSGASDVLCVVTLAISAGM